METPDGRTCFSCRNKSPLDGLLVCASYQDKLVSKVIHSFKYRFIPDLHKPLGKLMVKKMLASSANIPEMIIPVPLHKKRLRWRGFNQSSLLAKYISENLAPGFEIPIFEKTLQRNRSTESQMKIKSRQERNENVSGAFLVSDAKGLASKTVFLIDDVATTGSTIFECAKVLKNAGAKEVFAVVIARQGIDKQ